MKSKDHLWNTWNRMRHTHGEYGASTADLESSAEKMKQGEGEERSQRRTQTSANRDGFARGKQEWQTIGNGNAPEKGGVLTERKKGRTTGFVYKGNGSVPGPDCKCNGNVPRQESIDAGVLRRRRKEREGEKREDERTSGAGNSSVKRGIGEVSAWEKTNQKIGRRNWRGATRHEREYRKIASPSRQPGFVWKESQGSSARIEQKREGMGKTQRAGARR